MDVVIKIYWLFGSLVGSSRVSPKGKIHRLALSLGYHSAPIIGHNLK